MSFRRLLVLVGPRSYRKQQEIALFQNLPHFETFFLFADESGSCKGGCRHVHTCSGLQVDKILPDSVSSLVTRQPYSPVSFIRLRNLEKCFEARDVVNCIEIYSFISKQCVEIARRRRVKSIVSVFETISSSPVHRVWPFSENARVVKREASVFMAYSERSAMCLRGLSIPEDKIYIVYPGVDLRQFHPSPRIDDDLVRVLMVSGLAGRKGLPLALEAFSRLESTISKRHHVELSLCGKIRTVEDHAMIQRYSRKYRIRALGELPHGQMPTVYAQSDILLHPSVDHRILGTKVWEEQYGFALVEAMASGLPIVSTDCGTNREIIGPENFLVRQGSDEALAMGLRALIEDEATRRKLGEANRVRCEKLFDLNKQRAKVDEVLYRVL